MADNKAESRIEGISIIGLGKLGLCMVGCFAKKYKVIGVDVDKEKINLINEGKNPVPETGLTDLLNKTKNNVSVTDDYRKAVLNSQATFIVVATPSEADGSFSNCQLEESLQHIGEVLKEKNQYHLVAITSTVMPGTTEHVAKFILEEVSGKVCGKDFGLAYNPEFIALGSVIHDFLNPDFVLIGSVNQKDGAILEKVYLNICENNPKFAKMNCVNAEIAKIALNCYITMKITYANSLASICENIPGADANFITEAIGMDTRIGKKYIRPGLGYGGPCFPRDNVAFSAFARKVKAKAKLAEMVDEVNRDQVVRIENIIKKVIISSGKKKDEVLIGVLGLSYKPQTPIIEDSQAVDIVELLVNEGYKIVIYDPQALDSARGVFGDKVIYAKDTNECVEKSSILLIATPWEEFRNIDSQRLNAKLSIIDCWGILDKNTNKNILRLGEGRS